MYGLVTLMGSGEVSPGMVKVHRGLLDRVEGEPRPVFLDTPAGFELGIDAIGQRFAEYFQTSLGTPLRVARYHHREDPPDKQADALAILAQAKYIVAGPGSPTYAIRQLRDTPIYGVILSRWNAGAQLVFASAATVSLGRHALPVYEIYKVGEGLHWEEGLDLLGPSGYELAIIPHWDNAEGGTHDTRACFMGMDRFGRLRDQLPPTAVVLGVDEHTAVTLDIAHDEGVVGGRSGITVLRADADRRFLSGERFSLDVLRPSGAPGVRTPAKPRASTTPASLPQAASAIAAGDLPGGLRIAADDAPEGLAVLLSQAATAAENLPIGDEHLDPLIQLLVELRSSLRERSEWALADHLRDRLLGLGIELRDTPEGTIWVRVS
jgi:cyanophycinase-like exopeptidase